MNDIPNNLNAVKAQIKKACKRADKIVCKAQDIDLIAVSKKQPLERVKAMLEAGQRIYGENRVQEAQTRWSELKPDYTDVQLHLIGPLQTNKAKDAVALFDVIQTVDRPKLVDALVKEIAAQNKDMTCFIQVNTGEEDQKAGILPGELPDFLEYCRSKNLHVVGLMCIPPVGEPAALHFAFLKKLADSHGLEKLSMGMSSDFEKAIPLGATHVRVGTSLFGARPAQDAG